MNNNLDVKPEIIFKNLNSVLSKSITINVDLKKRNMSLYLHEYISIRFGNTQRTEPAFHDLFEEHVKDQLNLAHKRYRDHFNSYEFQEIIYNWITAVIEEFEKGNTIKLRVNPVNLEEEVKTFTISHVDELRSTQSYVTNEEYEHLKHLIDQREKMMHFLKDWEYETPLNDVLFHFKLYSSSVILLLLGLMKAGRLRLSNNLKGDIDIKSFKRFMVNKVKTLPPTPSIKPDNFDWHDLITPTDKLINERIEGYKFDSNKTADDLVEVNYLERNLLNKEIRDFLLHSQKKLQDRERG